MEAARVQRAYYAFTSLINKINNRNDTHTAHKQDSIFSCQQSRSANIQSIYIYRCTQFNRKSFGASDEYKDKRKKTKEMITPKPNSN